MHNHYCEGICKITGVCENLFGIKFAIFMANFFSELESLCYESEKSMDELEKNLCFYKIKRNRQNLSAFTTSCELRLEKIC